MTPFTLVDQTEDQPRLKLIIAPPYNQEAASCSFPFPTFFASFQDQTAGSSSSTIFGHDPSHKADKPIWHSGTSSDHDQDQDQACSSSSLVHPVVELMSNKDHRQYLSIATDDQEEGKSQNVTSSRPRAVKRMSSNMRWTQKITAPDLTAGDSKISQSTSQHQEASDTSFSSNSNTITTTRVCSDCNTSTTPLWRGGPRGPKSLCNACGIRQRKARRAMAEAAAAATSGFVVGATDTTSSPKGKVVANKEKKSRFKNKGKLIVTDNTSISDNNNKRNNNSNNKICFKALDFQRVFPQDVAEAAILLMELSCGLINHSS